MERKGRKKLIVIIIVLVALLVFAVAFGFLRSAGELERNGESTKQKEGGEASEEAQFAVNTTEAVLGPISDYLQFSGELVTASSVDIYADIQGILAQLMVSLGEDVRSNQIIAKIDPSRPGLSYALSPVKARVSGTITALPLNRGDTVNFQTPVATIGDLRRLQVVTAIPERFISRIRLGMQAEVQLEAWPGYTIPLVVNEINPIVDAASRTMEIKMDIPPGETRAKAGMYAEIRLTTDEKDLVVKVPADTVLRRSGEIFVYVVQGNKAIKRNVIPGISLGDVVEIIEGLEAGEKVVYQGQTLLEDGVNVNIVRSIQVIDDD